MKRIAKFHKVSKERFTADWIDTFAQSQEEAEKVYEAIRLPKRATAGSAGYDFFAPAEFTLKPGETVKIPTGIRVEMQPEWVLKCYPRSGLGFKYRLQLNNTVGIIDSDYFYSDNEGHIFSKITNDSNENKTLTIPADTGFMQGIFVEYGITVDDDATEIRNGGFVVLPNPPLRISVASSSTVIPYSTKIPCINPVSAGIVRVLFSLESFVIFEKIWPSLSE